MCRCACMFLYAQWQQLGIPFCCLSNGRAPHVKYPSVVEQRGPLVYACRPSKRSLGGRSRHCRLSTCSPACVLNQKCRRSKRNNRGHVGFTTKLCPTKQLTAGISIEVFFGRQLQPMVDRLWHVGLASQKSKRHRRNTNQQTT